MLSHLMLEVELLRAKLAFEILFLLMNSLDVSLKMSFLGDFYSTLRADTRVDFCNFNARWALFLFLNHLRLTILIININLLIFLGVVNDYHSCIVADIVRMNDALPEIVEHVKLI